MDPEIKVEKVKSKFIQTWAGMASNWGISKTMAEVHALLFLTDKELDTDSIMDQLQISRGNANMTLRSLLSWGLISKVEKQDSRKDLYIAEKDVWKITACIIYERSKREIEPVMESMKQGLTFLEEDDEQNEISQNMINQLNRLIEFLNIFNEVTTKLLPLIEEKNMDKIQALIMLLK